MKRLFFLFLIFTSICHANDFMPAQVLEGKISWKEKLYKTFFRALELIQDRGRLSSSSH